MDELHGTDGTEDRVAAELGLIERRVRGEEPVADGEVIEESRRRVEDPSRTILRPTASWTSRTPPDQPIVAIGAAGGAALSRTDFGSASGHLKDAPGYQSIRSLTASATSVWAGSRRKLRADPPYPRPARPAAAASPRSGPRWPSPAPPPAPRQRRNYGPAAPAPAWPQPPHAGRSPASRSRASCR